MSLKFKKILIGVCGGIAAYKSAHLIRLFKKQGAEVQVIMTPESTAFISPLTLSTLSEKPVLIHFQKKTEGEWNNHVALGLWADVMIIAPATAHTLGKMANGIADNLLTAVYFSARCPVFFAPAMDLDMLIHPSVKRNIEYLQSIGNYLIDAEVGELASGLYGKGRMAEPEHIIQTIEKFFCPYRPLEGKKVMITLGATREYLDPVRYITNASSGKMGFALAEHAHNLGAEVFAIVGSVSSQTSNSQIHQIHVKTALEMFEKSRELFSLMDYAIFCAAVADYRPKTVHSQKMKKSSETVTLELIKNPDIAQELSKFKKEHQITVGFALETEQALENARLKRIRKHLDIIVMNSIENPQSTFEYDTNQVVVITPTQEISLPLKSKKEIAQDIWKIILSFEKEKSSQRHESL
ncbi:MAG: bifunctional phosphopantothenoylcysteine decarboxylase/phosphopantothenate--cysteine ligase CoaBC [Cytophagales bacterium]|nr:bifunctional phosphopantothenoylcysteine decarboxylase/phosphopantothenate--cysteine ligase CoaBC [Cytophagales bacterium]MDW8383282.1 bifunctional phosphopantothenoylcysteine decarboxylase/phosphopantothenate--cysteine ligase CoaBC [Flammeovirgaceae bacterium]